jgi:hypothetical protein
MRLARHQMKRRPIAADDSEPVVPVTLREARGAGQALKTFVQENERMRPYLQAIESMVREMEAMTVS